MSSSMSSGSVSGKSMQVYGDTPKSTPHIFQASWGASTIQWNQFDTAVARWRWCSMWLYLKAHSHWVTAMANLFSVVSVHTVGHQQQWQRHHPNTYICWHPPQFAFAIAVATANPFHSKNLFHDDAIAIAVDAPSSVNTPHWIPHNPFMKEKILVCRCRCRHSVWTSL